MTNTATAHNFKDGVGGYTFATVNTAGDGNGVCAVCHTPHNTGTALPLWGHEASGSTFTVYASPTNTLDGTITSPSGASQLCLGCHDGTANLDAYAKSGAPTGSIAISSVAGNEYADFGTNLIDDHPISITYPAAADFAAEQMVDPATVAALDGFLYGTGDGTMTVECASCHGMHNPAVISKLLRKTNDNSALCLTCHVK
ncbi:cytochrome c3 family protein [Aestuariivivens sediminis]|uniref:cytochrome c3 family protein n=1 Tax=Aestuariivivens sediminis TaxID=2913557 RepID=UPI001F569280|nr:cytochrome c3 family protein [Aestuariivivens sediminis]